MLPACRPAQHLYRPIAPSRMPAMLALHAMAAALACLPILCVAGEAPFGDAFCT